MIDVCTILAPFVAVAQQVVNIFWIPLTFFGAAAPSVASFVGEATGCTF